VPAPGANVTIPIDKDVTIQGDITVDILFVEGIGCMRYFSGHSNKSVIPIKVYFLRILITEFSLLEIVIQCGCRPFSFEL